MCVLPLARTIFPMPELPRRDNPRPLVRPGLRRLLARRYHRYLPWLTAPDRWYEILPGRCGAFVSAVGWLFCRDATLLIFAFTFAFLLSIFPMIVLLISLTNQLPLEGLRETFFLALEYFFPVSQEWIVHNLSIYIEEVGIYQVVSLVLLAWAGSALFFALEAALECAYRVEQPRNFVGSQIRGTALVLGLGLLALLGAMVLHGMIWLAGHTLPAHWPDKVVFEASYYGLGFIVVLSLMCCAFHWLPNQNVPFRRILPEAVFATLMLLVADLVFRWLVPDMGLEEVYGPFHISVALLLWGYTFGNIIVGSARLGANGFFSRRYVGPRPPGDDSPEPQETDE